MIADCIIPARYASTRLPGKPLALIADKPMIQWVYEQASKTEYLRRVIVATDDERILQTVHSFGGEAVMTDSEFASGSDRVAKVAETLDSDIIINLQGDEPFIPPVLLDDLVLAFDDPEVELATPVCKIKSNEELQNPNVVKVCRDRQNYALYFSRSPIPYFRGEQTDNWINNHDFFKHVGIYAYRKEVLKAITQLPLSTLEKIERLEQLRMLENGYKIFTIETHYDSISIDTKEDLQKANQIINQET
jgi:3-deoxy-manno-octulosonate cytidylyltransferase (CMP-KDO synthetase)